MNIKDKKILDACCGGRMFWFDKENASTLFIDIRNYQEFTTGKVIHERSRKINPEVVMDFRCMDLPSEHFNLVVFDPPHMKSVGDNSFIAKTYGKLNEGWKKDLSKGFQECFRVLKVNGVLIFKWCEYDIPLREVLKCTTQKPIFGHPSGKQQKTHWITFFKES